MWNVYNKYSYLFQFLKNARHLILTHFHPLEKLKAQSIFRRIMIISLALILMVAVTISITVVNYTRRLLYEDVTSGNGDMLVQIDSNLSNLLNQLQTVVNVSDASQYFRDILTRPHQNQLEEFEDMMRLHRFLYNYYGIFTQYHISATVVGVNGLCYTTYGDRKLSVSIDHIMNEPWMQEAVDDTHYEHTVYTMSHPGITDLTEQKKVILMARSLINGGTGKLCGWIFIEMDPLGLKPIYADSCHSGEYLFITDGDGNVISTNYNAGIVRKIENLDMIPLYTPQKKPTVFLHEFNGEQSLAIRVSLTNADGYLLKFVDKNNVSERMQEITLQIMLIVAVFCGIALIISLLLSKRITDPIKNLSSRMASTRYGKLPDTPREMRQDELYTLEHTYDNLLCAIDTYTENIRKESIARREAELDALQMQLNPHFLYNTLSSCRYLIENGCDRQKISNAIMQLIHLLQGTLRNKKEYITLQQELENLDSYVQLMNLRYEGRIHVHSMITEDDLLQHTVPKLLLQPIVENAIFHGFPEEESIMDISIFVCRLNGVFRIEVSDNGCGIPENVLFQLKEGTYRSTHTMTGVGLNNIDQQLKLMYGPAYGLDICSTVDEGTIVTITMPDVPEQEERN